MGFFGRKRIAPLQVDIHSHLIPSIDDGARSMEKSIEMIREMDNLGFKKLITTPHIHPRYPNTPEMIMYGLEKLMDELKRNKIEMEVEGAAEYFVDETFAEKLNNDARLLSFGDRYVLVESSFLNKPVFFESILFDLLAKGYKPVLAHPERYAFVNADLHWLNELKHMGVMLQVTLGSIGGYYGPNPKKIGTLLLKKNMVDFLGSDLHRSAHLAFLEKGLRSNEVQQVIREGRLKNFDL